MDMLRVPEPRQLPGLSIHCKKQGRSVPAICKLHSVIFNQYIATLPAFMSVHCMNALCPERPDQATGSTETGVTQGQELPCGCQESNHGSLSGFLKGIPICLFRHYSLPSFPLKFYLRTSDPVLTADFFYLKHDAPFSFILLF